MGRPSWKPAFLEHWHFCRRTPNCLVPAGVLGLSVSLGGRTARQVKVGGDRLPFPRLAGRCLRSPQVGWPAPHRKDVLSPGANLASWVPPGRGSVRRRFPGPTVRESTAAEGSGVSWLYWVRGRLGCRACRGLAWPVQPGLGLCSVPSRLVSNSLEDFQGQGGHRTVGRRTARKTKSG